jgi:hypothetical protein
MVVLFVSFFRLASSNSGVVGLTPRTSSPTYCVSSRHVDSVIENSLWLAVNRIVL